MALKKRRHILNETFRDIVSAKTTLLRKLFALLRFVRLAISSNETVGKALGVPEDVRKALRESIGGVKELGGFKINLEDWDAESDALKVPVLNPAVAFHEALMANGDASKCSTGNKFAGKKVDVEKAQLFEAHFDQDGKILRDPQTLREVNRGWPLPYLLRTVRGTEEFKTRIEAGRKANEAQPERARRAREALGLRWRMAKKLTREGFGDDFLTGAGSGTNLQMDPNQYTEFVPTYGGPFFKQLYLYDYLKQHAYAFEAWNHNPLAKRIIQLLSQYSLGRRFSLRFKIDRQEKAWTDADAKNNLRKKICEFWSNEANIYGELFVDKTKWQSVDPSTIWDIITDPDNIDDAYYAYQSYPTAFQQFTGYTVPGEPGSAKQPAQKYILRQIPMSNLLHMKLNCVSNEKRGRTVLFPILGWLKRVKDLYNAQVIRQWLMASFIWDVTIKGSQADVDAYAATYNQIPNPGSLHVHNENVERKPMAAVESQGGGSQGADVSESILSFIATAIGVPKEFLNVATRGGGSRAQALTTAEPFTKVIEDLQSKWEWFIKEIVACVMGDAGVEYKVGDVEVTFPSVTKDTTTETVKNLQVGETQGWISKETAGSMYAQEMNITEYDFEDEQKKIKDEAEQGLNQVGAVPMPPAGRFGADVPGAGGDDNGADDGLSDIHGDGKRQLTDDLKNL